MLINVATSLVILSICSASAMVLSAVLLGRPTRALPSVEGSSK